MSCSDPAYLFSSANLPAYLASIYRISFEGFLFWNCSYTFPTLRLISLEASEQHTGRKDARRDARSTGHERRRRKEARVRTTTWWMSVGERKLEIWKWVGEEEKRQYTLREGG